MIHLIDRVLDTCVREDPMPYKWDGLMERTVRRWFQRLIREQAADVVSSLEELETCLQRTDIPTSRQWKDDEGNAVTLYADELLSEVLEKVRGQ